MAMFSLCNQFDQLADGNVVYQGTEHTEYADLEQPKEEKPKKKFSSGRLFGKLMGALVTVVAVAAVVGVAVAYGVSVVATGGASLAALPAVAGVMAAGFTAYKGTMLVMDQYNQDKAAQEEGSWGDYIGGALVNTAQIGAEEAVMTILLTPAGVVGGRVLGFAARYVGRMFAGRAVQNMLGKWFRMKGSRVLIEKPPTKPIKRPHWRTSEKDIAKKYPGYKEQKSFMDRKPADYGTKGSTRPDLYRKGSIFRRGHAVEVKNYDLSTAGNRKSLVKELQRQLNQRAKDLPKWTKQTVEIDVRGQNISEETMKKIAEDVLKDSPKGVEIIFRRM